MRFEIYENGIKGSVAKLVGFEGNCALGIRANLESQLARL